MRNINIEGEFEIDGVLYAIQASVNVIGHSVERTERGEAWGSPWSETYLEFVYEGLEIENMTVLQHDAASDSFTEEVKEPRILEKARDLVKKFTEAEVDS